MLRPYLFCLFPPHHLIHNPGVTLDDLHHLGGDIFLHVVRHRDAVVAVSVHLHSGVHSLKEAVLIDACQDKAALVQGLRTLCTGADTEGRERVPHADEEAALLRQGAAVADRGEGVHLQVIIITETYYIFIKFIPLSNANTRLKFNSKSGNP